ncbi:hypothetical protein PG984_007275 [Apiospora sp. TS-2023a]
MAKLSRTFLFFSFLALVTAYFPEWLGDLELCPSEIRTHAQPRAWPISDYENTGFDQSLEWIHEKLITCPNLTSLDLSVGITGCGVYSGPHTLPLDPFNSTKYAAALESLELNEYELGGRDHHDWVRQPSWYQLRSLLTRSPELLELWYEEDPRLGNLSQYWRQWAYWWDSVRPWAWSAIRCSLPGSLCHLTNLELWTKAMDFSKLRHLALAGCTGDVKLLTTHLVPKLSSLTSLSLSGTKYADMFLTLGKNTLDRISLINSDQNQESELVHFDKFKAYMAHHMDSLTSLEFRTHETLGLSPRPQIPMSDLRNLHALAPNLEELTMDLHRNGTWPMEVLDAIVEGAPASLKNLTLYLELTSDCRHQQGEVFGYQLNNAPQCLGINRYRQPILNAESATLLFNHLVSKAHEAGKPALMTARFRTGYWGRIVEGAGLRLAYPWIQDQQINHRNGDVTCTMLRDDGSRYELGGGICSSPRDPSKYYQMR